MAHPGRLNGRPSRRRYRTHNWPAKQAIDIQNLGAAVDGIQLRFTGTGTDIEIAHNPNRPGYQYVAPTEGGNKRYTMGDPDAPAVPAWNHAVGMQANVP